MLRWAIIALTLAALFGIIGITGLAGYASSTSKLMGAAFLLLALIAWGGSHSRPRIGGPS